jgi:isopentenyldiphosphate isomerase
VVVFDITSKVDSTHGAATQLLFDQEWSELLSCKHGQPHGKERDKMPARYARELGLGVIVIGSTNSSTWVNLDTLIGKCLF